MLSPSHHPTFHCPRNSRCPLQPTKFLAVCYSSHRYYVKIVSLILGFQTLIHIVFSHTRKHTHRHTHADADRERERETHTHTPACTKAPEVAAHLSVHLHRNSMLMCQRGNSFPMLDGCKSSINSCIKVSTWSILSSS
jgi:hypothetical protein